MAIILCAKPSPFLFDQRTPQIGIFGVGKHLKKHIKKWTIELAAAPLSNSDDEEEEEEVSSSSSSKKKKALSAAAAGGGKKRAAPAASGGAASKKKKKAAGKKGAEENGEEKKKRAPGGFATVNYDLSPSLQLVVGGSKQLPRPQVKMIGNIPTLTISCW
jgi:chromatin remodeling complex protein RSC6